MRLNLSTLPLSQAEQKFYFYLESLGRNTFKVSEIDGMNLGFSKEHLYVMINRLKKKGWITGVGKAVYLRLPASTAFVGRAYLEDPFEVGLKMYPGYLAYLSALKVHGLSGYEPFTIFVGTRNKSETSPLLEHYEIKAVKLGSRFAGFQNVGKYRVSTRAKTFFDCFCHPQYAGGYSEVLKSLHLAGEIDWAEMKRYLDEFGSSSLCQRIGYMLSLLEGETGYALPSYMVEYLQSRIKNKTRLHFAFEGGKYVREWMIMDNLGKGYLLSWWYNG